MITHFYSDPHFGHEHILGYARRPYATIEEHDADLEERYVATVGPGDCVLWCGDCSFRDRAWTRALLERLPGRKVLVRGNHDGTLASCVSLGFDLVADFLYLDIAGHKVTVAHMPNLRATPDQRYPERRPPKPGDGEFLIHGHTHSSSRRTGSRIHVGCDAWNYAPVPMLSVEELITEVPV